MDITTLALKDKIDKLETELKTYAVAAQNDIDNRRAAIKSATEEMQKLFSEAQREVDRRQGAIDGLKQVLAEQTGETKKAKKSK